MIDLGLVYNYRENVSNFTENKTNFSTQKTSVENCDNLQDH